MLKREMIRKRNSKKGFTLVELVVVIAILSIFAAIALATVIMIMDNARDSAAGTDAHTLDAACKSYMAGIYSGSINDKEHGKSGQLNLPSKYASNSLKRNAVKLATVINACEYQDLTSLIDDIKSGKHNIYVYDSQGTIYYADDRADLKNYVSANTTLGDLYGL